MFTDDMTLAQARDQLRDLVDRGCQCPCCTQYAKVYRRKINSGMARSLIRMWRLAGTDWINVPTSIGARSREEGKLAYWQLVEESTDVRDDGGRAGWWRVTERGAQFVTNQLKVPKYARVYDGRCLGLRGELVTIRRCLSSRFDYDELMSASDMPQPGSLPKLPQDIFNFERRSR